eukprot:TRINITY_DN11322_c0_g1_i1.p1 TRINITY_DN11322_c0_g1~~TRINITY_DN11322_c0_g1_i1.p1  ORF type:complete len:825 (-),score=91.18 TRINITY_DN11322_c0_g1_i1:339-2774(-)
MTPIQNESLEVQSAPAVGDLVQIFSRTAKAWLNARIADVVDDTSVRVEYSIGENCCRKLMRLDSSFIRITSGVCAALPTGTSGNPVDTLSAQPSPLCKWNSIGWRNRCDIRAATRAEDSDFVISFASGNKEENDRRLWHLQRTGAKSSLWGGKLKPVTFCTDRSLGTGAHFEDDVYRGRTNPRYDYLGLPGVRNSEEVGNLPKWFEAYREAALRTTHGALILNFTPEYLRSKPCRWEFGYIDLERMFVYIASLNMIAPLSVVKDDAELIASAFELSSSVCLNAGSDSIERAFADHIMELATIVDNDDDGKHNEAWCALPLYQILYTFASQQWGLDDAITLQAMQLVACAHLKTGSPDIARTILSQKLMMDERRSGADSVEVAVTLTNLGNACGALGDHDTTKRLLELALRIKERHYGSEHFEVAITLSNLGNVCGVLGDREAQKEHLERALIINEQCYGSEHIEVARTLTNLCCGVVDDNELKKQLLERALRIKERHYGDDHFEVAITLGNLGTAHGAVGDQETNKRLLERALRIEERHYGADHFEVAKTLGNLGVALGALGDHKTKMQLLERALHIKEQHYGLEHIEVAMTLGNLGNAHGALGHHKTRKRLLEHALRIKERHFGPDHVEVSRALGNLGVAYGALGDHETRKQVQERALRIEECQYGHEHHEVALTLCNLGVAYGALGNHEKNKQLLERALHIQERHYGLDDSKMVMTLTNLGHAYGDLGDKEAEVQFLERAMKANELHYGPKPHDVTKTVTSVGSDLKDVSAKGTTHQVVERVVRDNGCRNVSAVSNELHVTDLPKKFIV